MLLEREEYGDWYMFRAFNPPQVALGYEFEGALKLEYVAEPPGQVALQLDDERGIALGLMVLEQ